MRAALKAAIGGALFVAYAAPEHALGLASSLLLLFVPSAGAAAVAEREEREASARALRTLLALALTTASLRRSVLSPGLLAVACAHAAAHFLAGHRAAAADLAQHGGVSAAVLENAQLALFLLLLRFVLFPPASTLGSFQRHRTNLAAFFTRHDKKYVPYVDRLLEDHVGHERLLYARIRRLYRWRPAPPESELTS